MLRFLLIPYGLFVSNAKALELEIDFRGGERLS